MCLCVFVEARGLPSLFPPLLLFRQKRGSVVDIRLALDLGLVGQIEAVLLVCL